VELLEIHQADKTKIISLMKIWWWYVLKLLIFILEPELGELPAFDDEKYTNQSLDDVPNCVGNNTK